MISSDHYNLKISCLSHKEFYTLYCSQDKGVFTRLINEDREYFKSLGEDVDGIELDREALQYICTMGCNNVPVAHMGFNVPKDDVCYLYHAYTMKNYRNCGCFKALLEYILDTAKACKIKQVVAHVDMTVDIMWKTLMSYGFKVNDRVQVVTCTKDKTPCVELVLEMA